MGRTACTEPQCVYKGAFYLFFTSYIPAHLDAIYEFVMIQVKEDKLLLPKPCRHIEGLEV